MEREYYQTGIPTCLDRTDASVSCERTETCLSYGKCMQVVRLAWVVGRVLLNRQMNSMPLEELGRRKVQRFLWMIASIASILSDTHL